MAATGLGDSYRQSLRDSLRAMRLLPPGAWCLLTPDHSESLEPFAHTISDNMLHGLPPAVRPAARSAGVPVSRYRAGGLENGGDASTMLLPAPTMCGGHSRNASDGCELAFISFFTMFRIKRCVVSVRYCQRPGLAHLVLWSCHLPPPNHESPNKLFIWTRSLIACSAVLAMPLLAMRR